MDDLFLSFTAGNPRYPLWVRYILTLGLVGLSFAANVLLPDPGTSYPLLLFIPAVFLVSVIFDRGSGFLAIAASTILASRYFMPLPVDSALLPRLIFVLIGLCIATIAETLRRTLEKLSNANAYGDLLLRELAHRTRNDLATIISIMRLQAQSESNAEVQAAITSAIARVDVLAKVNETLRNIADSNAIDLALYVETLCGSLADLHRGVRPIAIRVSCDTITLKSSQAASIGLIINELVTNAFK
jgi:signal transduction histidine kinase